MSDLPNHAGQRRPIDGQSAFSGYSPFSPLRHDDDATDPVWLDLLYEAILVAEDDVMDRVIADMQDAGLSAQEIAETYVPAAARRLGDDWCVDQKSFARVTIGCSRLHGALRVLGPRWGQVVPADVTAPSVLVMVGEDIYHTLGATVLAGTLRRQGFSVKLWLGARPQDVRPVLEGRDYEVVLISSSSGESLEQVRRLVTAVKEALAVPPLVIVGGTITADGAQSESSVQALTGADHVTNDPATALTLCQEAMQPPAQDTYRPIVHARRI